jgi:hypothetical protein
MNKFKAFMGDPVKLLQFLFGTFKIFLKKLQQTLSFTGHKKNLNKIDSVPKKIYLEMA